MVLGGRTVLVTGGTPGSIGGETVRVLESLGAAVVTTRRSTLELTSVASVQAFASTFLASHDRLDVLVNNAGVHLDLTSSWKEPQLLEDGFEVHWRTNYLGTMHLTSLLLPLLLATPRSRVVSVSSKLHRRGTNTAVLGTPPPKYSSWDAYGTSKLALQHATNELARRHPTIEANSLHPGEVYTDIATRGLAEHRVLGRIRKALAPVERLFLMSPADGARTSVHVATAPDLGSGRYYARSAPKEPSPELLDTAVSARLWDTTQDWIARL